MKNEKFESYIDTSGDFSNSSIKLAQFYLNHKILFRKIVIGLLAAWSVLSILFALFYFGKYFFFDYNIDKANINQMLNTQIPKEIFQKNKPQDLQFGDKYIFPSSNGKYDYAINVYNSNKNWLASVSYNFILEEGETETKTVIISPNENRFLIEFGVDSPNYIPQNNQINIIDIAWSRIDAHEIFDPISYKEERLNFSIENLQFSQFGGTTESSGKLLSFDITNNTLFGYKEINFIIVLKQNETIIGFLPLYINNFVGLSKKDISFSLFNNYLEVDSIELQPIINVFDKNVYLLQ
ncbi:MAG: hypothetical protein WC070_03120 [Candidatus Magasanikbacteria bacterium]